MTPDMRRALIAVFLVIAVLMPAAARSETILRARLNADILSTEPGMKRDENTDAVLLHIVEGLVASREDGSVGPMLAKSWTVSRDGRSYTFSLRDGVTFHNGVPLTAADVVWSFRWYLDPANHWRCLPSFRDSGLGKILAVHAADPMTVTVDLSRPMPLFLKTLSRADCGGTGILQRASVGVDGNWLRPIGTGPFMLDSWRHGNFVDLVRFAHYASLPGSRDGNTGGKHALVDRVRFMVIPDTSAAVAALQRGSLDVIDGIDGEMLAAVRMLRGIKLTDAPSLDFYCLLLQVQDPILKDVKLRQAIALTIDTAGLTKAATAGEDLADSSPIPVPSPYHGATERVLTEPNLARARQLVAASTYRGAPIVIITNRRYPQMFNAAVLIQAMAAQAGINFQIQTLDWATQLSLYANGHYQAMTFAFSAKLDPSLSFDLLIGDKKKEPRKVWDSQIARALYSKSLATADGPPRQKIFDQLNSAFLQEVPAIGLFNSRRVSAVRDDVLGFREWPALQQRLWDVSLAKGAS